MSDIVGEKRSEPSERVPTEEERPTKKARQEDETTAVAPTPVLPIPLLSQMVATPLLAAPSLDMLVGTLTEQVLGKLNQPNLELEIRLGRMVEQQGKGNRISFPIFNPALLTHACRHKLDVSVQKAHFQKVHELLSSIPQVPNASRAENGEQGVKKFQITETATEDVFHGDGVRKSYPVDPATGKVGPDAKCICSIKKEKVLVMDIVLPNTGYDLRMCLSKEVPTESHSDKVQLRRRKFRTTFTPLPVGTAKLEDGTSEGTLVEVKSPAIVEMTRVVEGSSKETCEIEVESSMDGILRATAPAGPAPEQRREAHNLRVGLLSQLIRSLLCDGVFLASQCR